MCGISGVVNCGDRETLARMTHIQAHRGPDDSGLWERRFPNGSYVALGSRRLAILDLSSVGHMPMCNEDETAWITYNGEIYNFAELRRELEGAGYPFRSRGDAEVIVNGWHAWGERLIPRLRGMFALAIWDRRSHRLILARDRIGKKPLYYASSAGAILFGSEIKALLTWPG